MECVRHYCLFWEASEHIITLTVNLCVCGFHTRTHRRWYLTSSSCIGSKRFRPFISLSLGFSSQCYLRKNGNNCTKARDLLKQLRLKRSKKLESLELWRLMRSNQRNEPSILWKLSHGCLPLCLSFHPQQLLSISVSAPKLIHLLWCHFLPLVKPLFSSSLTLLHSQHTPSISDKPTRVSTGQLRRD